MISYDVWKTNFISILFSDNTTRNVQCQTRCHILIISFTVSNHNLKTQYFFLRLNFFLLDSADGATPFPSMPSRMFAIGEEPVGIRVSPYHKPYCISKILSALDENEVKSVRVSPFRKLVEIVEKPPFSRCFGWFLMSRHLKISKKHEGNSNGIGDDTVSYLWVWVL